MSRKKLYAVIVLAAVTFSGAGYVYRDNYVRSPMHSMKELEGAIEARNRLRFETYVDVSQVSSAIVDEVLAKSTLQSIRESGSGFALLGSLLGAQAADGIKTALAHEFKTALLRAVETGRLDSIFAAARSDTTKGKERKLDLSLVVMSTASDQMRFAGMGEIAREGEVATIGLRFRNELLDTTLVIRLRMEQQGARWKVTRPDNLSDYLDTIEQLQEARLAEENRAIRERISKALRIGPLTRTIRSAYYTDYAYLRARIENIGTEAVDSMMFMVVRNGVPVHRQDGSMLLVKRLAPGEVGVAEGLFKYNRFIDEHVALRYGDNLVVEPWLMTFYTQNGTSETVGEYLSWSDYLSRRVE